MKHAKIETKNIKKKMLTSFNPLDVDIELHLGFYYRKKGQTNCHFIIILIAKNKECLRWPLIIFIWRRISWHFFPTFFDSAAIPTYYVSKFAREKVKMVLTGDGGDEVLSGYNSYAGLKIANLYRKIPSPVEKVLLHSLANSIELITV